MSSPAAEPLYFGPPEASLFGWLHRAPPDRSARCGLVLCSPFGFEEICAHRTVRRLAIAAAEAGIPALRFDYAGCGDSSGDDMDQDRLGRWVASVHEAIDLLLREAAVERVCLVGIRLGAALASLAARERDDVEGLVALAPVVRGAAYLRELRMLAAGPAADAAGAIESAGFVITAETRQSLAALDLRTLRAAPAPRVLIVERDDVPARCEWEDRLAALGAEVRVEDWPGYGRMMTDPQASEVPSRIVEGVVSCVRIWAADLAARAPRDLPSHAPRARERVPGPTCAPDGDATLSEAAVRIGPGPDPLFGIVTAPATRASTGTPRAGVVLLNAGSVRHVGPNRLWVRLARRWAKRGLTVLRVDLSGIGDSPARPGAPDNIVYSEHASRDVARALRHLRARLGSTDCRLIGLCSGGYHAFKAAVAGQDADACVVVNPLTFFWKDGMSLDGPPNEYELGTLSSRYRSRALAREHWLRLVRGDVHVRFVAGVLARRLWKPFRQALRGLARGLGLPLKEDLARELALACEHGARLDFVFASGDPGLELLREQSGRALGTLLRSGRVRIHSVADADHTFTRHDARARLMALLDGLVGATPGGGADAPAPPELPLPTAMAARG